MAESKHIGLVDLGSNALRCEIVEVCETSCISLYRLRSPIRIGSEVFTTGSISASNIEAVAKACELFAEQCRLVGVEEIRGIATAAAREASNSGELVTKVAEQSGIEIDVISGDEECRLLVLAVGQVVNLSQGTSLLVDLGGGSVETILITHGEVTDSQSHPLGALRYDHDPALRGRALLTALEAQFQSRGSAVMDQLNGVSVERYVAVGGHMDALVGLLRESGHVDQPGEVPMFSTADLRDLTIEMSPLGPELLARRYRLKPDRADSILAAAKAYQWIASLVNAQQVWAPGVSLRQGMIAAVQGYTLG